MNGRSPGPSSDSILTPEQELDGVVTRRDVLLAVELVDRREGLGGDLLRGVVDDAGLGIVRDVVDVVFVERPRVEEALGTVVGIVDRAVVEPVHLGLEVRLARREPGLARRIQVGLARIGNERGELGVERLGRLERVRVAREHDFGVGDARFLCDLHGLGRKRHGAAGVTPASQGRKRKKKRPHRAAKRS